FFFNFGVFAFIDCEILSLKSPFYLNKYQRLTSEYSCYFDLIFRSTMMGAKIVAVLCTLLVVQIQADVNNVELEGLTGLLDPVIRIVNATENAILRGLANFKAGVVESEQKLQIIAHIIVNATNNLLTNLKDDLNEDLNKLKNQTSDAGKKLIDCVESEGNDTVAIAVNLVNGTIGCVNDNIGHVEQVIPPWIGQLEDVIRTVQNTTNGLEECNRLNIVLLASCVRKVSFSEITLIQMWC
ncbi:unnamed protein product, partial [Acanthoscelides obtectus]